MFCVLWIFNIIDAFALLRIFRNIPFFSDIPLQKDWASQNDYISYPMQGKPDDALVFNFINNLNIDRFIRDWM